MDAKNTWTDYVKINNREIEIKLDTGAQLNVMPKELYKRLSAFGKIRSTDKNVWWIPN